MSFAEVISNCSSFAVLALRFARLALMFLTEFLIMSSFLSQSNIDFSCSEIEAIVSSVSTNSSCESSSLSVLSWAIASFDFFASGDVVVFSSELAEFQPRVVCKIEVKGGRQTESSSRGHHSTQSPTSKTSVLVSVDCMSLLLSIFCVCISSH